MENYKVIKTKAQYYDYCNLLEAFLLSDDDSKEDDIELLEVLIDKWDNDQNIFGEYDPVELLQALMKENNMKQRELSEKLEVTPGYVSEILSYKKGFSVKVIRKLAEIFSVRQDVFNRPYALKAPVKAYKSIEQKSTLLVAEPDLDYGVKSKKKA